MFTRLTIFAGFAAIAFAANVPARAMTATAAAATSTTASPFPGCTVSPFTPTSNFHLAAAPLNDTSGTIGLQAYDNAGSFDYQFLFGTSVSPAYGDFFGFEPSDQRLTINITTNSGTTTWKSLAPTANTVFNFTTTQTDSGGAIEPVLVTCKEKTTYYATTAGNLNAPFVVNPWLQCQIPGWTTGLTETIFAPDAASSRQGCVRVGLEMVF